MVVCSLSVGATHISQLPSSSKGGDFLPYYPRLLNTQSIIVRSWNPTETITVILGSVRVALVHDQLRRRDVSGEVVLALARESEPTPGLEDIRSKPVVHDDGQ